MKKRIASILSILLATGSIAGIGANATHRRGDMNGDWIVNATDASEILKYYAELGSGLGEPTSAEDWLGTADELADFFGTGGIWSDDDITYH